RWRRSSTAHGSPRQARAEAAGAVGGCPPGALPPSVTLGPATRAAEALSAFHPINSRLVYHVRPLHSGKMAAIGDDDESRSGDAGHDFLRQRRRSELIAVADEHQRRTLDRRQERPCIRARHDRLLLAQEGLRSGLLGHEAHALAQRFVALP